MPRSQYAGLELNSKLTLSKQWGPSPGSIRINSIKEFERLLKLFPSDPKLIKSYADLLSKENFFDSALKLYRRAAILFRRAWALAAI